MHTLGINAAFHDPAACLVSDGRIVAAAEEERFTHIKHGKRPVPFSTWELPFHAIDFCLRQAGLTIKDIDHVAYSFDPYLLLPKGYDKSVLLPLKVGPQPPPQGFDTVWDPLFLASILHAPGHLCDGWPHHLQTRLRGLSVQNIPFRWHWVAHHLAHAVSAFHVSPFPRAAVLTLDGRGEKATTGYAVGNGNHLEWLGQVQMPHSLGLLYETVTGYLGFLHSCDEYKVMALASFGQPKYLREFREIVQLGKKGQYTIGELRLEERFGPARLRGAEIEQRHYDIAASLQVVLEETVLELARWLHEESKETDLCLAGGVALNCVMNARLRDDGPFQRIWVQPAAGDAGTALGAALWVDARERGAQERSYTMNHAYLGPDYDDVEIEKFLLWTKVPFRRLKNVAEETADILVKNKIIGWFQGRMEFGPRALGARSILASPIHPDMQARLNEIKDREDFRPVAPVVLEEEAGNWFVGADVSPFMLFVHQVQPEKAKRIPAVRHVDGTARIQTINREQCPRYYDLLKAFQARTGVPVLVNTSFNTRGEPIVCTPRDAVECFWTSPLDALVIGSYLLEKPSA
ncbi:MAG TPA: carbamoyltransferase C-terminal domain-containing protein [Gemmataceae bacterium]|nr:carbamoyltransferase C-terminal domain-containing protein [Gemmataceae bacterium]